MTLRFWPFALYVVLLGSALVSQAASPLVIHQGEVVHVRLLQQISSETGITGDPVKMEALADLVVDGRVIVRKGAPLTATIAVAKKKTKMTPGGRVSLHITDVAMTDGEKLALDTTQTDSGGGLGGKTYKALVVSSIVLLSPAGTAATLLLRGEEIVLPVGTELEAKVATSTPLDADKFTQSPVMVDAALSSQPKLEAVAEQTIALRVETSAGDGSLWVDDEFRGETPTVLEVKRGVHRLKVIRTGYKTWKQKVLIEGNPLTLVVALSKK